MTKTLGMNPESMRFFDDKLQNQMGLRNAGSLTVEKCHDRGRELVDDEAAFLLLTMANKRVLYANPDATGPLRLMRSMPDMAPAVSEETRREAFISMHVIECVTAILRDEEAAELRKDLTPEQIEERRVRDYHRRESPDKIPVPVGYFEEYRKKAVVYGLNKEKDMGERTEVTAERADAHCGANATQDAFPWIHYSQTLDAYLLDLDELADIFEADITRNYPHRREEGEQ